MLAYYHSKNVKITFAFQRTICFLGGGERVERCVSQEPMGTEEWRENVCVALTYFPSMATISLISCSHRFSFNKIKQETGSQDTEDSTCQDLMVMDLILMFTKGWGFTSGGAWMGTHKSIHHTKGILLFYADFYLLHISTLSILFNA